MSKIFGELPYEFAKVYQNLSLIIEISAYYNEWNTPLTSRPRNPEEILSINLASLALRGNDVVKISSNGTNYVSYLYLSDVRQVWKE